MTNDDRIQLTIGANYAYDAAAKVNASDPVAHMILTFKIASTDADPGVLQLKITTSSSSAGQITADGSTTSGAALGVFTISSANTNALSPRFYLFSVRCSTQSGSVFDAAAGMCRVHQTITTSTS